MNDRRLYFLVFGLWFAGCASSATTGESLDSDAQAASMSNTLPDAAARTPEGAIGAEIVEGKEDAGPGSEVETGSLSVSILSPESGAKVALGEVVSFSATFSTSSDDASGLTYRWESDQDGLLAEGEASTTSLSLEYQDLSAGPHTVSLTLTDALGDQGSDSLTLSVNRPPEGASTVSIAPQTPVTTDALIATIDEAALDPEGDPVTYTFTWTVDNTPSGISGDTVPAQETTQGQQWRVTAVPSDGHLSGPPPRWRTAPPLSLPETR